MTLLKDVLAELVGMFIGDALLSSAIIAVVAFSAGCIKLIGIEPLIAGGVLLVGCLAIILIAVRHAALSHVPVACPAALAAADSPATSRVDPVPSQGARAGLTTSLEAWLDRRRQRRCLAQLDDERLADIGITREDATRESNKMS
jgi:uncharacterized protein YjiS (DUF1127 family)